MRGDSTATRRLIACATSALALAMAGCSSGMYTAPQSITTAAVPGLHGRAFGGQQPVTNATIQLYGVGTLGYQSTATPLLTTTVLTDSNGMFTITGDYSCAGVTDVYLTVSGGSAGYGTNSAINLMATLGPCSLLTTNNTFTAVNELTTVAAAYALAPYMADYQHVGAPNTTAGALGIANAFATANNLVNTTTGYAPGAALPANATVPVSELNALADILGACVNSTSNSSGASCNTLFTATGASETIGAALAIAGDPGAPANTALFSLVTGAAIQFSPTIPSTPNDWTVAVKYSGSALNTPYGLAVDAQGDVWVANESSNSVTELSPAGAVTGTYSSGGILSPRGIAIDTTGKIWIANTGGNSIVEINSSGTALSGTSGYTAGSINAPVALAIDSGNNVWVTNFNGGSVTALSSAGAAINSSPLTGSGNISRPTGIAIDTHGNAWVSNAGNGTVAEFNNSGVLQSSTGYTDGALIHPQGIALDSNNNAYVAANFIAGVSGFNSSGSALTSSPLTGGGLSAPTGIAIDGAGSLWIANANTAGSVSKLAAGLSGAISPSAGYGALNTPVAVAVDGSGNVWTANAGDSTVSEFVGLATPVSTPIAATVGP